MSEVPKTLARQQAASKAKTRQGPEIVDLATYISRLQAQKLAEIDLAFECPMCGTLQSARDLIAAGAGKTFESVERYLGFSCVGRWTAAPSPRAQPDGKPCNWTLGGLFPLHKLAVETEDGQRSPRFAPASPERAQAHAARFAT
jgi:hypothetical protein